MSSSSSSGGIGVLGLLGVAFVILKLTGVIGWSWWWVTLPFWGLLALVLLGLLVWLIYMVLAEGMKQKKKNPEVIQRKR